MRMPSGWLALPPARNISYCEDRRIAGCSIFICQNAILGLQTCKPREVIIRVDANGGSKEVGHVPSSHPKMLCMPSGVSIEDWLAL